MFETYCKTVIIQQESLEIIDQNCVVSFCFNEILVVVKSPYQRTLVHGSTASVSGLKTHFVSILNHSGLRPMCIFRPIAKR